MNVDGVNLNNAKKWNPESIGYVDLDLINWPEITNNSSPEVHKGHLWEALFYNHIVFGVRIYLIGSLMKHSIFRCRQNYAHLMNA